MPRLNWGAVGKRYFETGVDRGVLFVGDNSGVAWTGLTSVSESPTGGEAKPYYMDGIKFMNIAASEEFEATIEAFHRPIEFAPCDGVSIPQNGLLITQQPRKPFGFSYRTLLGNDVDGPDHAYKIHLVYNALAAPSQRNNNSIGESVDPAKYTWQVTTLPPQMSGFKPTAHLVVDSRTTPDFILHHIERVLYGSEEADSRLIGAQELIDLFNDPTEIRLAEYLVDDFDTQNLSLWRGWSDKDDQEPLIQIVDGSVEFHSTGQYPFIETVETYNLTGSSFTVEISQLPNVGDGSMDAYMVVGPDQYTSWWYGWTATQELYLVARIDGAYQAPVYTTPWTEGTTHLRVAEAAGSVLFQTSVDGVNWVTAFTRPVGGIPISSVKLRLTSGSWNDYEDPGYFRVARVGR